MNYKVGKMKCGCIITDKHIIMCMFHKVEIGRLIVGAKA